MLAPAVVAVREPNALIAFLEVWKPLLPIPVLCLIIPALVVLFRSTWREIDEEAAHERAELARRGEIDRRPIVALVTCAVILTLQEYYGGRTFFETSIHPSLLQVNVAHPWLKLVKYDELYSFLWWAGTRVGGYVFPFVVWKIAFRRDSLLDLGLRTRGFFDHAWIYGLGLCIVLPTVFFIARSPDFATYYPFYKAGSRSWFDLVAWEVMYFAQFFALEMFFRGFWLGALRRSMGSAAIFSMAVPYCMIHFGKPYLEAIGAIVAGTFLGSVSMKTKSIYQGFLLHITIALSMDWLSLRRRHATPIHLWAPDILQVPVGDTFFAEEALRESRARIVELSFGGVFLVLAAITVTMALRHRNRRRAA